ncbi:alanine racemase [Rhizobium lusitanum]|uniref:Alanine racemase n=1 Tax=Rhizobium lusitanum TaxID=293958 RepID=A0A7X0IWX9_9HYPH|nr:alanine racemase [Rhizobium lusitanum]MBB6488659.1 alanine racemase [Rhizobium lusitanum]
MSIIPSAVFQVDLAAVEFNYRHAHTIAGKATEIAAVVKSDAYGLGLTSVAKALSHAGCNLFFVANLDEALSLRSAGLNARIVVFSGDVVKSRDVYREANLVAVVNSREDLVGIADATAPAPYFLNVETGFSRFGLNIDGLQDLKASGVFQNNPPSCIFSHLACSDNAHDLTNKQQRDRFIAAAKMFPEASRSLSASAGLWLGRAYHFDIARIGSALYGLNNARIYPNPLRSVARLRAPLVDIRNVPHRQAVGYGATFRTRRDTCLGIVGIGYKHGLPWACANKLNVKIGQYIAPVVGRISMEYTTVDLTDVPEFARERGGAVDFLYDDFGIDELAAAAGVNSQEVAIRLGASCPRDYPERAIEWGAVASMVGRRGSDTGSVIEKVA